MGVKNSGFENEISSSKCVVKICKKKTHPQPKITLGVLQTALRNCESFPSRGKWLKTSKNETKLAHCSQMAAQTIFYVVLWGIGFQAATGGNPASCTPTASAPARLVPERARSQEPSGTLTTNRPVERNFGRDRKSMGSIRYLTRILGEKAFGSTVKVLGFLTNYKLENMVCFQRLNVNPEKNNFNRILFSQTPVVSADQNFVDEAGPGLLKAVLVASAYFGFTKLGSR